MIKLLRQLSCVSMCWLIASCGGSSPILASSGGSGSGGTTQEALVWSDEFTGTAAQSAPNPANWTYDTGGGGAAIASSKPTAPTVLRPRRVTQRIRTHTSATTDICTSSPVNPQLGCTPQRA